MISLSWLVQIVIKLLHLFDGRPSPKMGGIDGAGMLNASMRVPEMDGSPHPGASPLNVSGLPENVDLFLC